MWDRYLKLMPTAKLVTTDAYGQMYLWDGPAVYNPKSNRWQAASDAVTSTPIGLTINRPDAKADHSANYEIRPDMDISFTTAIIGAMDAFNKVMATTRVMSDGTVAPTVLPGLVPQKVPGTPDDLEHSQFPTNNPYAPLVPKPAVTQTTATPAAPEPAPVVATPVQDSLKLQALALRAQAQKLLDAASDLEK